MQEDYKKGKSIKQKITEVTQLPKMEGMSGGILVTGFVEIEKIIKGCSKTYYIEKDFPFSVLILEMDKCGCDCDCCDDKFDKIIDEIEDLECYIDKLICNCCEKHEKIKPNVKKCAYSKVKGDEYEIYYPKYDCE